MKLNIATIIAPIIIFITAFFVFLFTDDHRFAGGLVCCGAGWLSCIFCEIVIMAIKGE